MNFISGGFWTEHVAGGTLQLLTLWKKSALVHIRSLSCVDSAEKLSSPLTPIYEVWQNNSNIFKIVVGYELRSCRNVM